MLKKIAAISLLLLLLFNWVGYRLVTGLQTISADKQLDAKIDSNDYDEASLIEIRVPLNMPYISDQPAFERHYGEVELNGKYYRYVKRKIENGELVLKCISNTSRQQISHNATDYFKDVAGLSTEQGKKQNNNSIKINFGEYDDNITSFNIDPLTAQQRSPITLLPATILPEVFIKAPVQPPDSVC